jgi:anti-sigma factor ChrR (cupin superfamily)
MNHNSEMIQELASLYALGSLNQHEARAFEEHLDDGCGECKDELQGFELVVGILGSSEAEAEPPPRVRERLRSFLAQELRSKPGADSVRSRFAESGDLLTIRADEGAWDEISEDVFVKNLFVDQARGTVTTLVRMKAGAEIPRHRHYAAEECLVLEGDVFAGGQRLYAGDYHCAMGGSTHETLSTSGGALLLIVGPPSLETVAHL